MQKRIIVVALVAVWACGREDFRGTAYTKVKPPKSAKQVLQAGRLSHYLSFSFRP